MLFQDRMDRASEIADSFPVDNADFEDVLFPAGVDVFRDDNFDVLRAESMEVEFAGDWNLDRVVVGHGVGLNRA